MRGVRRATPSQATARADQRVDLLLLAHDDVLEAVLEGLRAPLLARVGDHVLQRLDRLRLDLDEPRHRGGRIVVALERGDVGRRLRSQGSELLDKVAGIFEIGGGEAPQLAGEAVKGEAEEASPYEREGERGPVLEGQRGVHGRHRLLHLHGVLVLGHEPLVTRVSKGQPGRHWPVTSAHARGSHGRGNGLNAPP